MRAEPHCCLPGRRVAAIHDPSGCDDELTAVLRNVRAPVVLGMAVRKQDHQGVVVVRQNTVVGRSAWQRSLGSGRRTP